jgi:hypothetical protein
VRAESPSIVNDEDFMNGWRREVRKPSQNEMFSALEELETRKYDQPTGNDVATPRLKQSRRKRRRDQDILIVKRWHHRGAGHNRRPHHESHTHKTEGTRVNAEEATDLAFIRDIF